MALHPERQVDRKKVTRFYVKMIKFPIDSLEFQFIFDSVDLIPR